MAQGFVVRPRPHRARPYGRSGAARRLAALVTAERELVEEISRAGDAREAAADLPPDRWVALGPR
ncbi:hypothetical protein, partial [Streptomyces alkaliphilus]|uniref:hypothetical protein n=1 Tax=Streptomyces alkaliphilus TaxID=1472722 RepID=UPI00117CA9BF